MKNKKSFFLIVLGISLISIPYILLFKDIAINEFQRFISKVLFEIFIPIFSNTFMILSLIFVSVGVILVFMGLEEYEVI